MGEGKCESGTVKGESRNRALNSSVDGISEARIESAASIRKIVEEAAAHELTIRADAKAN